MGAYKYNYNWDFFENESEELWLYDDCNIFLPRKQAKAFEVIA